LLKQTKVSDPELYNIVADELGRQEHNIEMIASESTAPLEVMELSGSIFTNKTLEGYPGSRFQAGSHEADRLELLGVDRAKKLFGAEHANLQVYSGSTANYGVYAAVLKPGDKVLSMRLDQGGHLTHGSPANFLSKVYEYHFYGVKKHLMDKKLFGVFKHKVNDPTFPLFRGFDDIFYAPHSRHTTLDKKEINQITDLTILSESDEAGVYIISSRGGREFYVTGHSEYSPLTLHNEYTRDKSKKLKNVEMPKNYYPNDDLTQPPLVLWRSHANLLYINWLNYFVYQATPFNPEEIEHLGDL
jgi:hypothetical protein